MFGGEHTGRCRIIICIHVWVEVAMVAVCLRVCVYACVRMCMCLCVSSNIIYRPRFDLRKRYTYDCEHVLGVSDWLSFSQNRPTYGFL